MEKIRVSLLVLKDVCAHFNDVIVLDGINAAIAPGELVMLIGANASGKSTLVRVIAGLHPVRSGSVISASRSPDGRLRTGLAVSPDHLPSSLTGRQAMQLVMAALATCEDSKALRYAKEVGLASRLDEQVSGYSLGTKQKLAVALSLLGSPELILMDESLNGLDLPSVGRTLRFLRQCATADGQSVLLVTHNVDLAQAYVQRAWLLEDGVLSRQWEPEELARMRDAGTLLSHELLARIGI